MNYLEITLRSDLCCASGEAFGSSIDNDVCVDAYGLPFLPAKRLKGCLREAARDILSEKTITEIFGQAGDIGCDLVIGNAYIDNYNELTSAIKSENLHPNAVTQMFTTVRTQTKMQNGIADDGSLRSIRVMNEKSPIADGPTVLKADVRFSGSQQNEQNFANACKALRHIGLNRNRGLGIISCAYCSEPQVSEPISTLSTSKNMTGLRYSVCFKTPITIIGANGDNEKYIEGRTVIGCLAKEWLAEKRPIDDTFRRLFLSGEVVFSGLYPSYDNQLCYPVPVFLQKTKEKGELYNNILNLNKSKGTLKKLSGFAVQTENGYKIVNPKSNILYHNSISGKTLYMQESLASGQIYSGEIQMPADCADEVVHLLQNANLQFGRSKTAQYASCELCFIEALQTTQTKINLHRGEYLYVVLDTNLLVCNQMGVNTINLQQVKARIAEDLQLTNAIDSTYYAEDVCEYKTIGGFHTLWQLQKPVVNTVCAGSIYCFKITENISVLSHTKVGENNKEGFGFISLFSREQLTAIHDISKAEIQGPKTTKVSDFIGIKNELETNLLNNVITYSKHEKLLNNVITYAAKLKKIEQSASLIGRVALMLMESNHDVDDFEKRIDSIKKAGTKERGTDMRELIDDMLANANKTEDNQPIFEKIEQENIQYFSAVELFLTLLKYKKRMDE